MKSDDPSPSLKSFDSLLDPIPLPEMSESDTDTAWGLWEETLEVLNGKPLAEDPPPVALGFEPTQPVGLDGEPTSPD